MSEDNPLSLGQGTMQRRSFLGTLPAAAALPAVMAPVTERGRTDPHRPIVTRIGPVFRGGRAERVCQTLDPITGEVLAELPAD